MIIQINFKFYECRGLNKKNDILNAIRVMSSHGVRLAKFQKERGKPAQILPYFGSIEEYVNEKYDNAELIDKDKNSLDFLDEQNRLSGNGLIEKITDPNKQQFFSFGFSVFGKKINTVDGSLITTNEDDIDTYGKVVLEIALSIYQILRPVFGIVDFSGATTETILKEVLARKTKTIYWSTFFGPEYTSKYGKEYFLNAPTWQNTDLFDGGVLIQLSANLKNPKDFVELAEVKKYFSSIGVGNISWPNKDLYKW